MTEPLPMVVLDHLSETKLSFPFEAVAAFPRVRTNVESAIDSAYEALVESVAAIVNQLTEKGIDNPEDLRLNFEGVLYVSTDKEDK